MNAKDEQSIFRSSDGDITDVFGTNSHIYLDIIRNILPDVLAAKYHFIDNDKFKKMISNEEQSVEYLNQVVWTEILFRCHIVAATSLLRTCRLADATVRQYSDDNLPGWSSCARALLEAAGDSADALLVIPRMLAENHVSINRRVLGKEGNRIYTARVFEDILIHYTHARRIVGEERQIAIASHRAKQTTEYIRKLESFGLKRVECLYSDLCKFSHPASNSVQYMLTADGRDSSLQVSQENDREKINCILQEYRSEFDELFMVAFNPILISLRVFHKFNLFPKIPELRRVRFDDIAAWKKIEPYLKN